MKSEKQIAAEAAALAAAEQRRRSGICPIQVNSGLRGRRSCLLKNGHPGRCM